MHQPAYPTSAQGRQGHNKGPRFRGPRPVSSVNLGRLAKAIGPDMLASSLGMTEADLVKVIQGGEDPNGHLAHITHRLKEAGIPTAWLNQTNNPINERLVNDVRKLAAQSTNRAPIRRQNIQYLVDAFDGGLEELADVLELSETSVRGILDGRLQVDDERFNHLNPRLMEGGFPNGWLDLTQAKAHPDWLAKLKTVSAEAHQQEAQEQENEWRESKARAAEAIASAPLAPAPTPAPEPAAAPAASLAPAASPVDRPSDASATASSSVPAEYVTPGATPVDVGQQSLFGGVENAAPEKQAESPGGTSPTPSPALAASQTSDLTANKETPIMAKPQLPSFKSGNFAGAGVPQGAPKLPRGALSAGRSIGGTAAKKVAAANKAAAAPVAVKGAARKPAAPAPSPAPTPAAKSTTAPVVDNTKISNRAGKSPISREQSFVRADALHRLLEDSRRGAKVTLWRDLLDSSLPYWGNIRRGTVMLRDEMADDITKHLGLPDGWLDNATFPPPSLAPWVMDAKVPLPGAGDGAGETGAPATKKAAKQPNPRQPFARTPPSPAASVVTTSVAPPTAQPQMHRAAAPAPASTPAPAPTTSPAAAPAPVAPVLTISPQAHAAAAAAVVPGTGMFQWSPAVNPQTLAAPGPLVQALNQVLNQLSLNGVFTDQDALQLITMLTTTR